MRRALAEEGGLSVIEALIAMALVGVLLAAALGALFTSQRAWQRGEADADVQAALRVGVDQLTRELRTARRITAGSGTDITFVIPKRCGEGTPGSLCWQLGARDLDFRVNVIGRYYVPDGLVIRYALVGDALVRSVNGTQSGTPRTPVAQCGTTPLFAYDTADPTAATDVTVALCGTATRRGGTVRSTSEVREQVRLRNHGLPSSGLPPAPAALVQPAGAA